MPFIEERGTLEAILERLGPEYRLLVHQYHPTWRMTIATYLLAQRRPIADSWPRPYSAAEILEILRATGPTSDHPLQAIVMYRYDPDQKRGVPRGATWAEVIPRST